MRFSVPQFIDVEDKIFGPLTLKQGIYLIGSIGIALAVFVKYGFILAVLIGGPILVLGFSLAFVKIQGRPFIYILYAASYYAVKNKLYLWKKVPKKHISKTKEVKEHTIEPVSVQMSQSKLKQLAQSLDTNNMFDTDKKSK